MPHLIILGSGTGVPSLRRGSPGFLLISEGSKALIDSGSGTLRRILETGIDYRDIDVLLYTHTHPDHISDLVPILFANKYADLPRRKDLLLIGGPGFKRYFDQLRNIHGSWIEAQSYSLTIKEVSREPLLFQDLTVLSKPMAHLPESAGYRILSRDGKTIVFSGDTGYCRSLIDLGLHADLLVLECSFPDERKVEGHLTPSLAARIGSESGCKRLLLTHLYPVCDSYDILQECRRLYPGDVILGEDLMKIEI